MIPIALEFSKGLFVTKNDSEFIDSVKDNLNSNPSQIDPLIEAIKNDTTIIDNISGLINIVTNDSYSKELKFDLIMKELRKILLNHENVLDALFDLVKKNPDLFCFAHYFSYLCTRNQQERWKTNSNLSPKRSWDWNLCWRKN
jgi:hypothetical protein